MGQRRCAAAIGALVVLSVVASVAASVHLVGPRHLTDAVTALLPDLPVAAPLAIAPLATLSVPGSHDVVAVGAGDAASGAGALLVLALHPNGQGVASAHRVPASDLVVAGDALGTSLAVLSPSSPDALVAVGAPGRGAVFVLAVSALGQRSAATAISSASHASLADLDAATRFGAALASMDVDRDGRLELFVGAPARGSGEVVVLFLAADGSLASVGPRLASLGGSQFGAALLSVTASAVSVLAVQSADGAAPADACGTGWLHLVEVDSGGAATNASSFSARDLVANLDCSRVEAFGRPMSLGNASLADEGLVHSLLVGSRSESLSVLLPDHEPLAPVAAHALDLGAFAPYPFSSQGQVYGSVELGGSSFRTHVLSVDGALWAFGVVHPRAEAAPTVLLGSAAGLGAGAQFGSFVGPAGDRDGDGVLDWLVGAAASDVLAIVYGGAAGAQLALARSLRLTLGLSIHVSNVYQGAGIAGFGHAALSLLSVVNTPLLIGVPGDDCSATAADDGSDCGSLVLVTVDDSVPVVTAARNLFHFPVTPGSRCGRSLAATESDDGDSVLVVAGCDAGAPWALELATASATLQRARRLQGVPSGASVLTWVGFACDLAVDSGTIVGVTGAIGDQCTPSGHARRARQTTAIDDVDDTPPLLPSARPLGPSQPRRRRRLHPDTLSSALLFAAGTPGATSGLVAAAGAVQMLGLSWGADGVALVASRLIAAPALRLIAARADSRAGLALTSVGDVDGNGVPDLVVGSTQECVALVLLSRTLAAESVLVLGPSLGTLAPFLWDDETALFGRALAFQAGVGLVAGLAGQSASLGAIALVPLPLLTLQSLAPLTPTITGVEQSPGNPFVAIVSGSGFGAWTLVRPLATLRAGGEALLTLDIDAVHVRSPSNLTVGLPTSGFVGSNLTLDLSWLPGTAARASSPPSSSVSFPAPTLQSIAPRAIPQSGGLIALVGTQLPTNPALAIHVDLGGEPCEDAIVLSSTLAQCVAPEGTAASVNATLSVRAVRAPLAGQLASTVLLDAASYTAPVLTGTEPSFLFAEIASRPAPNTTCAAVGDDRTSSASFWIRGDGLGRASRFVHNASIAGALCGCLLWQNDSALWCSGVDLRSAEDASGDVVVAFEGVVVRGVGLVRVFRAPVVTAVDLRLPAPSTEGSSLVRLVGREWGVAAEGDVTAVSIGPFECADPVLVDVENGLVECVVHGGVGADLPVHATTRGGWSSALDGRSTARLSFEAPVITAIEPDVLLPGNGSLVLDVTVRGTNLGNRSLSDSAPELTIGGEPCPNVLVLSHTSVLCRDLVAPSRWASNAVRVNVSGQVTTSTAVLTAMAPPSISFLAAQTWPTSGATNVSILGRGFGVSEGDVTHVRIGHDSVPFWFQSSTELTATLPAGSGEASVEVTTRGGLSALAPVPLAYDPPVLEALDPAIVFLAEEPVPRPPNVTLRGWNFGGTPSTTLEVSFGGQNCSSVTWVSASEVRCEGLPLHLLHPRRLDVALTVGGQAARVTRGLLSLVDAPRLLSVSPSRIPTAGGAELHLLGASFGALDPDGALATNESAVAAAFPSLLAAPTVLVGGRPCEGVRFESVGELVCTSPPGAGQHVPVRIRTAGGLWANNSVSFLPPTVASVAPARLFPVGLDTVSLNITGSSFGLSLDDTWVFVSGQQCPVLSVADSFLTCGPLLLETLQPGNGSVEVRVGNQAHVLPAANAIFEVSGLPRVTQVLPATAEAGDSVTILGEFFGYEAVHFIRVEIGGVPCANTLWVRSTQLRCEMPNPPTRAYRGGLVVVETELGSGCATEDACRAAFPTTHPVSLFYPDRTAPLGSPGLVYASRSALRFSDALVVFAWCEDELPLAFDIEATDARTPTVAASIDEVLKAQLIVPTTEVVEATRSALRALPGTNETFLAWDRARACRWLAADLKSLTSRFPFAFRVRASNRGLVLGPWSESSPPAAEICVRGEFMPSFLPVAQRACRVCPTGGWCPGGDFTTVRARAGYYRLPWNPTGLDFAECPVAAACVGVTDVDAADASGGLQTSSSSPSSSFSSSSSSSLSFSAPWNDWVDEEATAVASRTHFGRALTNAGAPVFLNGSEFATVCEEGYMGLLCASCEVGFARETSGECRICASLAVNLVAMIGGFLAMIVIAAFLIWSAIISAVSLHDTHRATASDDVVTRKILLNHMQQVAIMIGFRFTWPGPVEQFLIIFDFITSASDSLISTDCIRRASDPPAARMRTLVNFVSPFGVVVLLTLVWLLGFRCRSHLPPRPPRDTQLSLPLPEPVTPAPRRLCCRHILPTLMRRALASFSSAVRRLALKSVLAVTVSVVAFSIHTPTTKAALRLFTCRELGTDEPKSFVADSLADECNSPNALLWRFVFGLPALLFYSLGIPFALIYGVLRYRTTLDRTRERWNLAIASATHQFPQPSRSRLEGPPDGSPGTDLDTGKLASAVPPPILIVGGPPRRPPPTEAAAAAAAASQSAEEVRTAELVPTPASSSALGRSSAPSEARIAPPGAMHAAPSFSLAPRPGLGTASPTSAAAGAHSGAPAATPTAATAASGSRRVLVAPVAPTTAVASAQSRVDLGAGSSAGSPGRATAIAMHSDVHEFDEADDPRFRVFALSTVPEQAGGPSAAGSAPTPASPSAWATGRRHHALEVHTGEQNHDAAKNTPPSGSPSMRDLVPAMNGGDDEEGDGDGDGGGGGDGAPGNSHGDDVGSPRGSDSSPPISSSSSFRLVESRVRPIEAALAFMVSGYEPRVRWWEAVVMLRKSLLAAMIVFLGPQGLTLQLYGSLAVMFAFLMAHSIMQPYVRDVHDALETISLAVTCITLLGGLFLSEPLVNTGFKFFCSALIVAVNVGFLVLAFGLMVSFALERVNLRTVIVQIGEYLRDECCCCLRWGAQLRGCCASAPETATAPAPLVESGTATTGKTGVPEDRRGMKRSNTAARRIRSPEAEFRSRRRNKRGEERSARVVGTGEKSK